MILQPKKRNHALSKHVDWIDSVSIDFNKGQMAHRGEYWCELIQVGLTTMCDLINKDDEEIGQPKYFALTNDNKKLLIYPRPDSKYNCRVLGSIRIEQ
jgi:hypothetical protein